MNLSVPNTNYLRDVNSRTKILDEYLDKCGAVLMEQTEITSEAMRVMGAKNWVGFIARARDEMTPKILDFCNRREEFTNIKLPGTCFYTVVNIRPKFLKILVPLAPRKY